MNYRSTRWLLAVAGILQFSVSAGCSTESDPIIVVEDCDALDDGAACDDGDSCTQNDVCVAGTCQGQALDCSALDSACTAGTCVDGACQAEAANHGTSCDDGDVCTGDGVCAGGTCETQPLTCEAFDALCLTGMCGENGCESVPWDDGTSCGTHPVCPGTSTCNAGECIEVSCSLLGWTDPTVTSAAQLGSPSEGGAYEFLCPTDEILVGFSAAEATGWWQGIVTRLNGVCAKIDFDKEGTRWVSASQIPVNNSQTPFNNTVGHSTEHRTIATRTCATDEVLVGARVSVVKANGADRVTSIQLECAPFTVDTSSATNPKIIAGAGEIQDAHLGGTPSTSAASSACPAGQIAVGIHGRSGQIVDAFGISCVEPDFEFGP